MAEEKNKKDINEGFKSLTESINELGKSLSGKNKASFDGFRDFLKEITDLGKNLINENYFNTITNSINNIAKNVDDLIIKARSLNVQYSKLISSLSNPNINNIPNNKQSNESSKLKQSVPSKDNFNTIIADLGNVEAQVKKTFLKKVNIKIDDSDIAHKFISVINAIDARLNNITEKILKNVDKISANVFKSIKKSLAKISGIPINILHSILKLIDDVFNKIDKKILNQFNKFSNSVLNSIGNYFKNYFNIIDKATTKYRQAMALFKTESMASEAIIKRLSVDLAHMGASAADISISFIKLNTIFSGILGTDKDLVSTTTQLNKQFGISAELSSKFLKTISGINNSSIQTQKSILGYTRLLAQASGIPINILMEDVANASNDARVYMGESAVSLINAAATARILGIDMETIASAAKNLLQFDSSITNELRASALIGQNINFNNARRLMFNRDTKRAMEEIRRIAKEASFSEMNVIQQEAFARASGVSVSKLQDMLQQEKSIQWVRNNGTEIQKSQLYTYERLIQLNKERAAQEGYIETKKIEQLANQERLNQLQDSWNKMLTNALLPMINIFVIPLLDFITKILSFLISHKVILNAISLIIGVIGAGVVSIAIACKAVTTAFMAWRGISAIIKFLPHIKAGIIALRVLAISSIRALSVAIMNIPIAGWIAAGITLLVGLFVLLYNKWDWFRETINKGWRTMINFWKGIITGFIDVINKGWHNTFNFWKSVITGFIDGINNAYHTTINFWKGIIGGFITSFKIIGDFVFNIFHKIYKWISDLFVGQSSSKLGRGIVNGIVAIKNNLIDVLFSPFKTAFNKIINLFSSLVKFISPINLITGKLPSFSSIIKSPIIEAVTPNVKPNSEENKFKNNRGGAENNIIQKSDNNKEKILPIIEKIYKINDEYNNKFNALIDVISDLNNLLESGNIAINLDGTKLNYALSNAKSINGNYGEVTKL